MKVNAKKLHEDAAFDLRLELLAGAAGLSREISHPRIQKPGLAIAGFVESIQPNRVQILGKTEVHYINTLTPEQQCAALTGLFTTGIACVVVTSGLAVPKSLLDLAEKESVPVFRTTHTSGLCIGRIQDFLDEHLSPETTLHAVLVDVFGVGILLTGPSGIGKSECALDLVLRGHRLVADDVVIIKQRHNKLVGMGSELTHHHMEVRGLGIISVKDLFGAAAVRERKQIELIVELIEWHPNLDCDRTGIDDVHETLLEVPTLKIRLPIRPGRNLAALIEVAARNHLLKLQGHHSARELKEKLERQLAAGDERLAESE